MAVSGLTYIVDYGWNQIVKPHLVLITIALNQVAGGLERNFVRLANYFVAQGYLVSAVSFDLPGAASFYKLDPRIVWNQVGTSVPHAPIDFFQRWKLIKNIRDVLKEGGPSGTVAIVFHHGILVRFLLAAAGLKIRVICAERNSLSLYQHIVARKWNANFLALTFVHKICVLFDSYCRDYPAYLRSRIVVIPNVVEGTTRTAKPADPNHMNRFSVLSIGRLCRQKNFDVLIQAFSALALEYPDWDLKIYGGGDKKQDLQSFIEGLGLSSRVFLLSETQAIDDVYEHSHIYAVTSQWEGFPNAVAEAMSHGLPTIGFSGCAGVSDLINHGKTGLLADGNGNVKSLIDSLRLMMGDPRMRQDMGQNAKQSILDYSPEKIYKQWEDLISSQVR
jgi:GalNAc-alpha-(1->4)-GalNAc-alpha-(1->3)-diNAcBac-PP-undecaprenol alpha-1,4-N-acetyl-D-galactosaminyltransferase